MTDTPRSVTQVIQVELGELGLDRGGHLLVKRALARPEASVVHVTGTNPNLETELRAFCRSQGHVLEATGNVLAIRPATHSGRFRGAYRTSPEDVADRPMARWGLAARGATIEAGCPEFDFPLSEKDIVWAEGSAHLYSEAAAAQWDPAKSIPWSAPFALEDDIETAVVQVMTFLIENETAALLVPARFLARIHPHFRESLQLLAIQAADEARHIEVFTRRALLRRDELGLSTAGGQASLKTLLDEPDFALASFLLSVLGEGTFLSLLAFIRDHAPDPVTRAVAEFAGRDEARHVAFGMAHLERHLEREPALRERLGAAIRNRHDALAHTAGLNDEVFDALVLLAAGGFDPEAIRNGWDAVVKLNVDMDAGRRRRLRRLGFDERRAQELSSLHTRNFM
jgi:hypothetical protein